MKTFSAVAAGLLLALSAVPSSVAAPQFGNQRNNRDRVCVYKDIRYQGQEQCYSVGDEVANLRDRSKSISSIRIYGRARVTVYDDTNFDGKSAEFSSDVPDLGLRSLGGSNSWSDRIESLRVSSGDGSFNPGRDSGRPPFGFPQQGNPGNSQQGLRDGVCVYEQPDYRGRSECWREGEDVRDLARQGNLSDKISSIRVFGRSVAVVYRDTNFQGERLAIDRDIPDLSQVRARSFGSWNRQISSLQVETERGRGRGR